MFVAVIGGNPMLAVDCLLLLFVLAQPHLLTTVAMVVGRLRALALVWAEWVVLLRSRSRGIRFFECSAITRQLGLLRYSNVSTGLCVLFVLYDLDLLFFFAEMVAMIVWA
jgi:hypothetical protein